MTEQPENSGYATAESSFRRALSDDDAWAAVTTLELIGRAALAENAPASLRLPVRFASLLADNSRLVARAASVLGTASEMDGEQALPQVLYARSGYQALLDAGIWPQPPLDQFHLDESDEEIHALVAQVGVPDSQRPGSVPVGHTWWPGSDNAGVS